MKVKLKNLATIQMGYSFRSRLEVSPGGDVAVIQMKDLLSNNTVDCCHLMKIDMEVVKNHHLVRKRDLVFRSRGQITTSAVILEAPGKAVVAAPLLRIRVTAIERILPEYLNWYINQREAQIFLTSKADGTTQKMISKQTVENLEVSLPPLEQQKSIVELALLSSQEQTVLRALTEKRKQYVETILIQLAEGLVGSKLTARPCNRGIKA
ncbi:MAG: restriction endonuclease subunit S [Spirochaetales bacterium]|nr:restriction endonuclease subunit S [Spirochaetales bacterium]